MTPHSALRERLTAAFTVLGTLSFTLALLAGMPYVLWRATGVPWPDRVSSWQELGERLAEPLSDPLVIDLLAVVGWVCWAAFACTVIREICWYTAHLPQLLHDRRAHKDHVAALSVKGALAAVCIGTLVVAVLSLWRPSSASAQQPPSTGTVRPPIAVTVPVHPSTGQQTPGRVPAALGSAKPTTAASHQGHPEWDAGAAAVRHVEYMVREGDTLWDIAHTYLGDALKWPRIYALNKDHVQHDGGQLSDPDLLKSGWQLTLPVSQPSTTPPPASDKGGLAASDTAVQTSSAPPSPARPTPDQKPATGQQTARRHAAPRPRQDSHVADQAAEAERGPAAIGFGEASLIGITTAAGLLATRRYWYVYQRRLRRPEAPAPALSPLVDKAAQAAQEAAQPHPPRDPEDLVTRRTPPQQPRSADTVTIGVDDNAEIPLDLLAAVGGCTWTGPGAEDAARALLTGILTAAERQRPAPPRVSVVVPEELAARLLPGLPPQFTALTQAADTAQAVRLAEQHLVAHARTQHDRDTPPPGPEAANLADEAGPGSLVLLAVPDAAHIGQIQAVAARSRPGILTVLTLDTPLPGAEHWHIAADGTTTRPGTNAQHPGQLELFRLAPDAGRDMTEVLLGAHGQRPPLRALPKQQPPSRPARPQPAPAHDEEPEPEPAVASDPPPTSASRPQQITPVRLHVLGPVTLYVRGHAEPVGTNLRPEVRELLALLAAHPTGLLTADIADKLHLEPGTEQNALKNLRRAVRRTLRAATGITEREFILRQGELHKLHPDLIETDLSDFTRTLRKAFSSAGESAPDALAYVRAALSHYCGPFAQGTDHLWADAIREHLTTQATDAALRLAHQAEHTPADPQQRNAILTLLEHLGVLHPDHELLTQHAIRLYQAAGRHDAARHAYTRLERHLAELGLEPDPATQALVAPRTTTRRMG
ncbi:DNA-binding SARP family transcriptional activator [Streptomyces sp. 2333.5]|uniref:BTAD domain-containing putative transcriptional regulator n=1 Tax=unclassified Streptomyces TaxID=2593676 RepID=UPI00089B323C|nr:MULTISPECIES: BTAD domain-containing putative transcriptional regulator [unclassified Streptomyces]PJJ04193.1 DNA-binding SARP family transcriptional activator [Streptomyces sp. 2333.5]SEE70680.1 DNA-binding transcriptional activator of the SARP family [Streptomyces sp. 2112.2]